MTRKSTTPENVTTRKTNTDPVPGANPVAGAPDRAQVPRRGRGRPPLYGYAMSDAWRSETARKKRQDELTALAIAWASDLIMVPKSGSGRGRGPIDRLALRALRRLDPERGEKAAIELDRIYGPDASSDAQ